jgi:uncharacterized membrane protein
VTTFQWLLVLHVLSAFLMLGGGVVAGLLHIAAMRRDRPSEVSTLLGLTRVGVIFAGLGSLGTIGFGVGLASHIGLKLSAGWLSAAIALWVASAVLGGAGGRPLRHARYLAERLAGEGDAPSAELQARVSAPVPLILNWASGVATVAILALMIWKPGA